jgi:chromosome segregation ATPase
MEQRFKLKSTEGSKLSSQLRDARKDLIFKSEKLDDLEMDHSSLKNAFHATQSTLNSQAIEITGLKNQVSFLNNALEQKTSLLL